MGDPSDTPSSRPGAGHNHPRLSLHIPEPDSRPGEAPDFSDLVLPRAGETPRPPTSADVHTIRDLAFGLVRVLDGEDRAVGPWDPGLSLDALKAGLRTMVLTRAFDERMFTAQRTGKTSFYMKCTGEEAIGAAQAQALGPQDMAFPTYRQQALLIGRGCPLQEMMCQIYSNECDPLKGRQLPVLYSSREFAFFSISGNLGTQFSQAVGWGMASAYKGDDKIAAAWIGEGSTAEGDFHYALTLASVYHAPAILNVVNNQWAISSFSGIAQAEEATFASHAIGYGLPALRVDGNDFLAVYAATRWAHERASANLGATLIEFYTYRAQGHSTTDDPSRYRPQDEAKVWPLGDPIGRLCRHLITLGAWSMDEQTALEKECADLVRAEAKKAEAHGVLGHGARADPKTFFEDVYKDMPAHLIEQRKQSGV